MSHLGAVAAFSASVTWAFASERYAEAARGVGTVQVNLLRALSASSFWLVSLSFAEGVSALAHVSGRNTAFLAASIACSYALGDGLFFRAAGQLGVSAALAIATIYPLWAALYGALVHGEPFGPQRALGVIACLGGISALLALGRRASAAVDRKQVGRGALLALLASLAWAGNTVLLKQGAQGISVYQANVLRFSFGALFLLAQLPFRRRPAEPAAGAAPSFGRLARRLALPLVVDTWLGSVCFVYGIAHTDLALGATLSSLSPLFALPIAAWSGAERVTVAHALAVCLTVLGVVLLVAST